MLNTVYRLVAPRRFEAEFTDIDLNTDAVIVRPTYLSICNADQRYYQGKRNAKVLKEKLPMALIHEGIGSVVFDAAGEYDPGDDVVMVPNTPFEEDDVIAENYLRSSRFRASGYDGFMQDLVAMRRDRLVRLPAGINKEVAAFTEFVSVGYHAVNRFDRKSHSRRNAVGFWGDGNLSYVTSLIFKKRFPDVKVYVFGIHESKMRDFMFVDGTYNVADIPDDLMVDHAFECIGGQASGTGINQIIDHINPEGTISILGVSEEPVPIFTRMVLEKGLTIFGSSRSGVQDFRDVISIYEEHPEIVDYLEDIVSQVIPVKNINDMNRAFDEDIRKAGGKTVMIWEK